jgi:hypothetical protein
VAGWASVINSLAKSIPSEKRPMEAKRARIAKRQKLCHFAFFLLLPVSFDQVIEACA